MIDYEILQDIITDHELCKTQKNELAKVVELLKADRLIELPCNVGDTVYWLYELPLCPHLDGGMKPSYTICETNFEYKDLEYLGEYVFLTKEEAEARLEELKGGIE